MAVIGAGFAIVQAGRVRLSGVLAWLAWAGVHLQFLTTSSPRLTVFLQWIWSFLTGQTGVRLIVNHSCFQQTHDQTCVRCFREWHTFGQLARSL
jgi:hypothetical protein